MGAAREVELAVNTVGWAAEMSSLVAARVRVCSMAAKTANRAVLKARVERVKGW